MIFLWGLRKDMNVFREARTWNDVDFERGLITVWAADAKNDQSLRVPYINAILTRTLETVRIKSKGAVYGALPGWWNLVDTRDLKN